MIRERAVLLGVEHFQKGRLGVSLHIPADLVDFVKDDDRVARARVAQALDDAAGQGADIGAPVAADFGLVMDAAKRDALELSAEGPGYGSAEAGLADAWRAGEAHDGPTRFGFELVNAEELQNAVLDLVEAVVIRVQGLPGIFDVEVVL